MLTKLINFLLKNPEIIEGVSSSSKDEQIAVKGNLRIWTKFFDAISGITDFRMQSNLISNLASASLPSEHLLLFQMFVDQKLDLLMSPKQLLEDEKESIAHFKSVIGSGANKRQDLSAIFAKRLLNYALLNCEEMTKEEVSVYKELLKCGYLSSDLVTISVKKLILNKRFSDFIKDKDLTNHIIN